MTVDRREAAGWSPEELDRLGAAEELEIAVARPDGTLRRWVPIWVVRVDGQVYVRTWYRRDTGWFGQALATRRARIRVPGIESDVIVEDVGRDSDDVRVSIDAAYVDKYGRYGRSTVDAMTSASAVAATLQLVPTRSGPRPADSE